MVSIDIEAFRIPVGVVILRRFMIGEMYDFDDDCADIRAI